MDTCESGWHYLKYDKIYILNQHNHNDKDDFRMVSHQNYNLNVNEDFVKF